MTTITYSNPSTRWNCTVSSDSFSDLVKFVQACDAFWFDEDVELKVCTQAYKRVACCNKQKIRSDLLALLSPSD